MIWCDSCTSVAHLECVKLTVSFFFIFKYFLFLFYFKNFFQKEPDKWNCEDCLSKLVTRRMTRSCNKL